MLVRHMLITSADDLTTLANEMKEYARSHPLDYHQAITQAMADPDIKASSHQDGAVKRFRGPKQVEAVKPYTRFITFDGEGSWQITYIRGLDEQVGWLMQLTVVRGNQVELSPHEKYVFASVFLDPEQPVKVIPTPPHVLLLAQTEPNPEAN